MHTRHLLVDLDGTLLGNREMPLGIEFTFRTARAFRKHSGGWLKAVKVLHELRSALTLPPGETEEPLTNDRRAVQTLSRTLQIAPAEAEDLLRSSILEFFPRLKRHFYPILEARNFLDWAKTRFPMTLATDPFWPEHLIKLRLEWAGIDPAIFQFVTHSECMHSTKPNPEYYREILAMRDLRAEECLLIGNDLEKDLPATRVGIPVFIVTKDRKVRPLRAPKGSASAWKGSFEGLKAMLPHSDPIG